jgi:UDP-N-acetylglucosamine--N-acetylmuramyl-(pentapeptide) pyrophosphoryl-undecaprenol N-acetylglucosamine transferase
MRGNASTYAVVAGGGTAGHVSPGLAIAEEIVRRGAPRESVHYVGSDRGVEARLVPAAGFPLTLLPGRGIQRRLTFDNLGAILGLVRAFFRAVVLVRRLRPAVVIGMGGYASVPCVLAAVVWRVPIVVAEQNAVPGAANRLAARFAKAVAASFPDTELPRATWTGNPVRPEVLAVDAAAQRADARVDLGVAPDRVMVTVFGGSLGARRINDAVFASLESLRGRSDLSIRHIAGIRDHDDLAARVPVDESDAIDFTLLAYEDGMPTVFAATDIVVCRSGASSVAELAAVGVPSILVPLPGAPGDHQTANARGLVPAGAAVLVADAEFDGVRLAHELDQLVVDDELRRRMAEAAIAFARPDAAASVVDLVERHAHRPLPGSKT